MATKKDKASARIFFQWAFLARTERRAGRYTKAARTRLVRRLVAGTKGRQQSATAVWSAASKGPPSESSRRSFSTRTPRHQARIAVLARERSRPGARTRCCLRRSIDPA
jgi:hypothetical protein